MPGCLLPTPELRTMEEAVSEEEPPPLPPRESPRRNLFGTVITPQDRQDTSAQLREISEQAAATLEKYEIVGVEREVEKTQKPPPRPPRPTQLSLGEDAPRNRQSNLGEAQVEEDESFDTLQKQDR